MLFKSEKFLKVKIFLKVSNFLKVKIFSKVFFNLQIAITDSFTYLFVLIFLCFGVMCLMWCNVFYLGFFKK